MATGPEGAAERVATDEEFVLEVLRINDRYNREVVEAFNVCPFARRAREVGEVERRVLLQRDPSPLPALLEIERLESAACATTVIALLIFPRLTLSPVEFDRFTQEIRSADDQRRQNASGLGPAAFAAATFHPEYPFDARTPARLVTFFRRSPDPTIQLVRFSVVDALRGDKHGKFHFDVANGSWQELERRLAAVSITDRITTDNHAMALSGGVKELEAIYADIRADRATGYARFAGEPG